MTMIVPINSPSSPTPTYSVYDLLFSFLLFIAYPCIEKARIVGEIASLNLTFGEEMRFLQLELATLEQQLSQSFYWTIASLFGYVHPQKKLLEEDIVCAQLAYNETLTRLNVQLMEVEDSFFYYFLRTQCLSVAIAVIVAILVQLARILSAKLMSDSPPALHHLGGEGNVDDADVADDDGIIPAAAAILPIHPPPPPPPPPPPTAVCSEGAASVEDDLDSPILPLEWFKEEYAIRGEYQLDGSSLECSMVATIEAPLVDADAAAAAAAAGRDGDGGLLDAEVLQVGLIITESVATDSSSSTLACDDQPLPEPQSSLTHVAEPIIATGYLSLIILIIS